MCDIKKPCLFLAFWALVLLLTVSCRGTEAGGKGASEAQESDKLEIPNPVFFGRMKPYLREGYTVSLVARGHSMLPTIHDNTDVVTLQMSPSYQEGDIVLAELPGEHYVLHRIIDIQDDSVTIKGDHNKSVEHTVMSRILARMTKLERDGALLEPPAVAPSFSPSSAFRIARRYHLSADGDRLLMVDTVARHIDMHQMMMMNESARLVLDSLRGADTFGVSDMVRVLTAAYEVDDSTAYNDCTQLLGNWVSYGLAERVGE